MSLGRQGQQQQEFWVPTGDLPKAEGHVFYRKLNSVLAEAGFDRFVEELCGPFYADGGRPSIPPGVYFRMLLVGYFEGIGSQRGIACFCRSVPAGSPVPEYPVHPRTVPADADNRCTRTADPV